MSVPSACVLQGVEHVLTDTTMHVCTCLYMCVYTCVCVCMCMYVCTHMSVCVYVLDKE